MGHRAPGLRAQVADGSALRFQDLEASRRDVGLSQPCGVRARLDREQPRLDRAVVCTRDGQCLQLARHRRRAPGGGRRRRRRADRRYGLRGAQQPRPLGAAGGDRAQRQRSVLCADGVAVVPERHRAPIESHLYRCPGAPAPALTGVAGARRLGLLGRALGDERSARDADAPHVLRSSRRPLRRPDRRARHRAHGAGVHPCRRVGRSDRGPRPHAEGAGLRPGRRGRGAAPARREGESGRRRECRREFGRPGCREFSQLGRRRRGLARVAARDGCRRVAAAHGDVRRRVLSCAAGGGGRGFSGGRSDGGHAWAHRTAFLPGSVPRTLLRRRHRRAARGDVGGRHGHGRIAARRGGVLHVLQPGVRPSQPRRRPPRLSGRLHARPGRHHRRRRAEPPRDPRHGAGTVDPGHDGVRTLGR